MSRPANRLWRPHWEAWEESGRYSAGNGAVMRCAPLAIRWVRDDVALARNTALSAVVTHADPRCVWSGVPW